jgi:cytidylate kinase
MSIVAISETLGSLGDDLGRQLAQRRGFGFADREIIAKAAERFGRGVVELTHATEERPTLWERLTASGRRYQTFVEAIILEQAARGDVVLAGRGAVLVLASISHALRVRIDAPERVRAARVRDRQGLTEEGALDAVRHSDRDRSARLRFLYDVRWDDPLLYDVVINTERIDPARGAGLLDDLLADERFRPTEASRQGLADRSVEVQVRAALLADVRTEGVTVLLSCRDGQVTIGGTLDHEATRDAVEEVARGVAGVTHVHNELTVARARRTADV